MGTYVDGSGKARNFENRVVELLQGLAEGYANPENAAAIASEAAETAASAAETAAAAAEDAAEAAEAIESTVLYVDQELTDTQKAKARANIGAAAAEIETHIGKTDSLLSGTFISGTPIKSPEDSILTGLKLNGPTNSAFDGVAVIEGVNIKVTSVNGQTSTNNLFMVGSGQINKANGTTNFVTSWLKTATGDERVTGRDASSALEISLLKSRCEYTVAAANAYFAAHPLIVWYTSTNASPSAYYQYVVCETDNSYSVIGTMDALAQLASGDSIDFKTGAAVIGNTATTVRISADVATIPAGATITATGSMDVTAMTSLSGKVDISGWNQVVPLNTTFFENVNYFSPDSAVVKSGVYANEDGEVTASSGQAFSLIMRVKPSTSYVLYVPDSNRGNVVENQTAVFSVGTTYTVICSTSTNNITFTTGATANYIFAYVYNGEYDYDANKGNIRLVEGNTLPAYTTPTVKKANLPQDVVSAISPLNGKNILIFGDSITSACNLTINGSNETTVYTWKNPSNSYVDAGGNTIYYSMWPKILRDSQPTGEIRCYAFPGASYKSSTREAGSELQNVQYQIDVALNDLDNPNNAFAVDDYAPDIVIFALGTNDGAPNDTFDTAMSKTVLEEDGYTIDVDSTLAALDDTKYCESARMAFLRVKQAFPLAQIYCVLPIQRANNDTNWGTLREYLSQMAKRYGCVIIDGTAESGITREFNTWNEVGEYLKDGLHPNDKGQNLMARMIISALRANYIPFGDGFNQ